MVFRDYNIKTDFDSLRGDIVQGDTVKMAYTDHYGVILTDITLTPRIRPPAGGIAPKAPVGQSLADLQRNEDMERLYGRYWYDILASIVAKAEITLIHGGYVVERVGTGFAVSKHKDTPDFVDPITVW